MSASLRTWCDTTLSDLRAVNRFRRRRIINGAHAPVVDVDRQRCINFCSNDYLGLAADPRLAARLGDAAQRVGTGSAASPRRAANIGVITALIGKRDHLVADALNHASLIDGARLSGACKQIYPHGNAVAAAAVLAECRHGHRLLVSDSVFSMDGDTAPLAELAEAAEQHDAWLMVDDAHGLGVFGDDGAGRVAEAGLTSSRAPLLLATLGKSVGVSGAFLAGDDAVIEAVLQRARSLIFSTAPSPALAAAAREGVSLARGGDTRRAHLHALIARFRSAMRACDLPLGCSDSPIQPLIVGDERAALDLSEALLAQGYLVGAIRPPTVAPGTSRLRITLTAAHDESQVDGLVDAIDTAVRRLELRRDALARVGS